MNICRNLPTGFNCLDIILGENLRDLDGNLTDVQRGFSIGTQAVLASEQAAGKTTFTIESMVYPIKLGYPCHKIIIFDTDGNVYKRNRLLKLSHFTEEELDKYVKVYNTNIIEDIIKTLQKEQEEYMSMKYKPVKFFDHIRQEEVKMMPYVAVIMDTVTSMTPRDMDIEGAGNIGNNTTGLTKNRLIADLINSMQNFFDKNILTLWLCHLVDNDPKIGQTVAAKDFKAAQGNKRASIPKRLKFKADTVIWFNQVNDGANQESKSHIRNEYGLEDIEGANVFSVNGVAVKNRTGTDARTKFELVYKASGFDRNMTLIVDCLNQGVLAKDKSQYPNAEFPHVFKDAADAEYEQGVMGRRTKAALKVEGYRRPTNVIEARLLLDYNGVDPTIRELQAELYVALLQGLEDKLSYELDSNCVTSAELESDSDQLQKVFGFMAKLKRPLKLNPALKIKMPDKVDGIDNILADDHGE